MALRVKLQLRPTKCVAGILAIGLFYLMFIIPWKFISNSDLDVAEFSVHKYKSRAINKSSSM